jgi:acetyl-CoA carboxylase carboxyltransferase component
MDAYHWLTLVDDEHRFLRPAYAALGAQTVRAWVESDVTDETFTRSRCDGLVTAVGECDGRPVAIAWSDFRVRGACCTHANSRRFSAFLRHLGEAGPSVPLIYVVSSSGVSLM